MRRALSSFAAFAPARDHRGKRGVDQLIRTADLLWVDRRADGCLALDALSAELERGRQGVLDPERDPLGGGHAHPATEVADEHDERVALPAGGDVAEPGRRLEPLPDPAEHLVAGGETVLLVQPLES